MKFSPLVRAFLLIVALCGLLFFVVVNFSVKESRYECIGKFKYKDEELPKTLFILIEEYRWWVGLWNDGFGTITVEEPGLDYNNFLVTDNYGPLLHIKDHGGITIGCFSTLSKNFDLKWNRGVFTGKGTLISN